MRHINKDQKTTVITMGAIGLAMLLAFTHMSNWGRHSASIVFVKAGVLTGLAGADTYRTYAQACVDNGHYDCAKDAYLYLYQATHDPEVVGQLAELLVKTKNYSEAASTFVKYYQLAGKNPRYAYFYGQTLEKLGENQRAINAYKLSIEQNPTMLSVNATKSLVKLLLQSSRGQEAYDLLSTLHETSSNAPIYFKNEMNLVAKYAPAQKSQPTIQREIASSKPAQKAVVEF